jgi:hypothetical protein
VGIRSLISKSTFRNQKLWGQVSAGVERSLYSYEDANRRLAAVRYQVGLDAFSYYEETIFGKRKELKVEQSATFQIRLRESWGSIEGSLEGATFLDSPQQNRVVLSGSTSWNIGGGFELVMSGNASRIRDQIYLPRGGTSPEEVLTRRRELATNYQFFLYTGFSYTFGSRLAEVVNPRFGGFSPVRDLILQ